ncbi:hypothetical protein KDW82_34495 [Burkholderia vietnamiensis]|uniref:hypothetical protein n=1 Tax=Burkholderia vietnamiensis TaxID=60552 RepID=UPI001B9C4B93|nr:hypothetical protein [Burkholderia vietnamiensis]MBR8194123.1 hypothetical protein [Burkholderia vietnamiensis]
MQPQDNETKQHLIIENGDELAVDGTTTRYLLAFDLIYRQGEDTTINIYHITDPHTWDDVERAIASFDARDLPKRTVEAAVAEAAADAFWNHVVAGFPEMTSGDTLLTDEDVGAFYFWLTGVKGGYAGGPVGLPAENVPPARVDTVLAEGIRAAQSILTRVNPALPAAPEVVVSLLRGCVRHQLHWNYPREPVPSVQDAGDDGADGGGAHLRN